MKTSLAPVALALLAGCNQNMVQQPRYDHYERSALFPDGQAMQAPPDGTVDLGQPARKRAMAHPPAVTAALVARGRERYGIFCSMCHGIDGRGNGVVVSRGFPAPHSLLAADQTGLSDRQIFDAIGRGYGIMFGHADRIPPRDRWAITAWVRVLQDAQQGAPDGA